MWSDLPSDVKRAIVSAGRLDRMGYRTVLDGDGSYIENKTSGEKHPLIRNSINGLKHLQTGGPRGS